MGEPDLAPPRLEDCPDRGTIEMALASPRAGFGAFERYVGLPQKSAVLAYTLAKSQACPDGNKRIALILLHTFLHINGVRLEAPSDEIADHIIAAAESEREARDGAIIALTEWLEGAIVTTGGRDA